MTHVCGRYRCARQLEIPLTAPLPSPVGWRVAIMLAAWSSAAIAAPRFPPTPPPDRLVPYKATDGGSLSLHVFAPPGPAPEEGSPAIILFFGGGWKGGDPAQFYPQCRHFASLGFVAMSAEYRVESRHGTTPRECVEDGKSAIRWVRDHAGELNVDPTRIVAGGGSAGGHVAAAAATGTAVDEPGAPATSCRPDALVLFNPVFNNGPGGYGYSRVAAYWRTVSPMHNIDDRTPPTIVFFGSRDKLVPVDQMREYERRMKSRGIRCDLHIYEGQKHGFFNHDSTDSNNNRFYSQTLKEADAFLASLGVVHPADKPNASAVGAGI
ncbi:Acetylxylan esterase precursor [Posidoniimonas corsicana]|uniref:Acetylxylan esterase n=2 Tax=Posidoniimonas corsicana TaxID=1938618 RepID=A0A5C5VAN2_9BACT|nr:Acetylxylan esterase precursor [Posidoniimonas corsicana]